MSFTRQVQRRQMKKQNKLLKKVLKTQITSMTQNGNCVVCNKIFTFGKSDVNRWYVTVDNDGITYKCFECQNGEQTINGAEPTENKL